MTNKNISIENAHILPGTFRNFSGEERKFNVKGDRNFCVEIPMDLVDELKDEGWNIKYLRPRNPEDEPVPYMQVKVKFGDYPPNIFVISGKQKTKIDEDEVDMLDWAEIENADVIIRPYNWEAHGNTGVKGYLKTMYVTVARDEFASKYEDDDEPF